MAKKQQKRRMPVPGDAARRTGAAAVPACVSRAARQSRPLAHRVSTPLTPAAGRALGRVSTSPRPLASFRTREMQSFFLVGQISDEKNDWAFWGWVVRLYRKGPTPTSPLSARLARVWQGVAAREQSIRSVGGGRSVRPGWQACGGVRSRRCWVAALPRRRPAASAGTPPLQIGC